jgi:hypothetical protein
MSDKTDYKRLKNQLLKENFMLFNELEMSKSIIQKIIVLATEYVADKDKLSFFEKIKKECKL